MKALMIIFSLAVAALGGFTFGDKLAKTSSVDIVIFVNSVQYDKIKS